MKSLLIFLISTTAHAFDKYALEFLKGFEAIQLDMWSDTPVLTPDGQRLTAQEWAEQLGLFYAPALVFFDERGKEIIRIDSVVRLYRLRGVLEYVLHKGYLEAPTFQRWREMQSATKLGGGIIGKAGITTEFGHASTSSTRSAGNSAPGRFLPAM